ncbi:MAG: biotin/lipoyl-containing protein [Candidatus Bathyarchaeia archaeon]
MPPFYEVFIDGKPKKVELARVGENLFTLKLDGKNVNVELPGDKIALDGEFSIRVDGKSYRVRLPKIERGKIFAVNVEDVAFRAEVKAPIIKPEQTFLRQTQPAPALGAVVSKQSVEGIVVAPMTGKILSIKVKKGEAIKAGQILCILEAMKMENEVAAPKSGTIREIYVFEGSSVSEGEPLFKIE